MQLERLSELVQRLALGREEAMQRLLTTLILDGPYPRWNTRSTPSPRGLRFLSELYVGCFAAPWPSEQPDFIDEVDLPARSDEDKGAAPDYGVLWADRLWLIELKPEAKSHRREQVPYYLELTHHHYPHHSIDLTYLTPPMATPSLALREGARFSHVTWHDVAVLIRAVWGDQGDSAASVAIDLCDAIAHLHLKPSEWRTSLRAMPARPPNPIADAMALAHATAEDGQQRALNVRVQSLDCCNYE